MARRLQSTRASMRAIVLAGMACAACTVGGRARVEATLDDHGRRDAAVSLGPAVGASGFDQPTDVAHQAGWFSLFGFGLGWGTARGAFAEAFFEVVGVPGCNGGVGGAFAYHIRIDARCTRFTWGAGVVGLLAQLRADDNPDQFGPNPHVERVFHEAGAFAGFSSCNSGGDTAAFGVDYEVGLADLLFAPGP